jgi:HD-like signal output (HDOD) protein
MQRSAATISESLKKVPPFPPVAAKLLRLLSDPGVDTNQVADLIGSDATFTARLLQRVNSAEFGFVSDITNVRRAVALLGLDTTRQVTLAHATASYAQGGLKTETMRRCWQHTVATAVLADEIAAACDAFGSVAFTAGIMHDVGRLGLLVAYPEEYERVVRNAADRCLDLLDFEEEEFGAHHAEAGRMLAERWELPSEMAVIAGRHHDPCEGAELSLLRIVHVACRLADVLGYDVVKPLNPSTVSDVVAELPARARVLLVQDPRQLCERVEQRIREFGSEPVGAPPEETLALLASASGAGNLEQVAELKETKNEGHAESEPVESADEQTSPSPKVVIIVSIVAGLAVLAAAAFLALR